MTTEVVVWILDSRRPTVAPQRAMATIHRTKVGNWAIVLQRNGIVRRFKVGTTAFFVEKVAVQRWQGNLDRIRKSNFMAHFAPSRWEHANAQCRVNVYRHTKR